MSARKSPLLQLSILSLLAFFSAALSACVTFTAATDGTSASVENITDGFASISEGSTEVSSSTSPQSDAADVADSSVAAAAKKEATREFAKQNFLRLRRDIANGGGEYISAVSEILNVPQEKRARYFQLTQAAFPDILKQGAESTEPTASLLYELALSIE